MYEKFSEVFYLCGYINYYKIIAKNYLLLIYYVIMFGFNFNDFNNNMLPR